MKRILCLVFAVGTIFGWMGTAAAGVLVVNLNSGSNWLSTTNEVTGANWIAGTSTSTDGTPATAPYPNPVTTPQDIIDNVSDKASTTAELMWACDTVTPCDGINGPTTAFFRLTFFLPAGSSVPALLFSEIKIDIIADDFFDLWLNGKFLLSGTLSPDNQTNGQPDPLRVDPLKIVEHLRSGQNILAIKASDKDTAPVDYEHVFVDGRIVVSVPEPGSMVTFVVGLAAFGFLARRRGKIA